MADNKVMRVAPTHGIEHAEIHRLTERVERLEAAIREALGDLGRNKKIRAEKLLRDALSE